MQYIAANKLAANKLVITFVNSLQSILTTSMKPGTGINPLKDYFNKHPKQ